MIKELIVGNKTIKYKLVKKNNKNTYFRYKDDYLEISMPKKLNENIITNYLTNNFNKFYEKYINHLNSIPNKKEVILEENSYNIIIIASNEFKYSIIGESIYVYTNLKSITEIKKQIYKNHLIKMINKINKNILTILKQNNIKPLPYRISYFKSKFGSYHKAKKEITLNLILAKANINYLY